MRNVFQFFLQVREVFQFFFGKNLKSVLRFFFFYKVLKDCTMTSGLILLQQAAVTKFVTFFYLCTVF